MKERTDLYKIEILEEIAKNTNSYQKGLEIDYDRVYIIIINDLKEGRIKNITFD